MKRALIALAITVSLIGGSYGISLFIRTQKPVEAQLVTQRVAIPSLDADVIHGLVNAERAKAGLQPLVRDTRLDASACEKMATITSPASVTHDGYATFIDAAVPEATIKGENLADSNQGSSAVVNGWMASQGHRDNILHPEFISVGYCSGTLPFEYMGAGNMWQVVQHFTN